MGELSNNMVGSKKVLDHHLRLQSWMSHGSGALFTVGHVGCHTLKQCDHHEETKVHGESITYRISAFF